MKNRREHTDEEKHKFAEKVFGENYDDPGSLWDYKTPDINWDAFEEDEIDDSVENSEKT